MVIRGAGFSRQITEVSLKWVERGRNEQYDDAVVALGRLDVELVLQQEPGGGD